MIGVRASRDEGRQQSAFASIAAQPIQINRWHPCWTNRGRRCRNTGRCTQVGKDLQHTVGDPTLFPPFVHPFLISVS
eukprot:scaffold7245_cov197-Ochromonas_danica.AAC.3